MILRIYISLLFCLLVYSCAFAQSNKNGNHVELGLGVVISPDYKDAMVASYSDDYDISGAFGWIDLEVGYAANLAKRFYFIPRLRFLISRIEIKAFRNLPSSQYANIIFLPGGSLRYTGGKNNSFYVDAHLNAVSPHFDLARVVFESDGLSLGAELGLVLGSEYELGFGFLRVPVKILSQSFQVNSANFGGFGLTLRRRF